MTKRTKWMTSLSLSAFLVVFLLTLLSDKWSTFAGSGSQRAPTSTFLEQAVIRPNEPLSNTRKMITYSLYGGTNPRYLDGAIANAISYKTIYPDWEMRVYHDDSIPQKFLQELIGRDVELIDMTSSSLNKMSWRFLAASDPSVSHFCSRDIDSRLSKREKAAVDEWLASGRRFHVMRDHPSHSLYAMSGGMWCATHEAVPNMKEILTVSQLGETYLEDMNFLNDIIWPIAQKSVLQHDSFSCRTYEGSIPFPTSRVGSEHVGSIYIAGEMRSADVNLLQDARDHECLRHAPALILNHKESMRS